MAQLAAEVTTEFLQAFADAWNRHDIDALMSHMTDDCVFEASGGPEVCGTRYAGREAVRAGFIEVWTTFPDAHWGTSFCVWRSWRLGVDLHRHPHRWYPRRNERV